MTENINQKAEKVDWNNSDSIIDFYEGSKLYFDNYQLLEGQDSITDAIDVKLRYISALIDKNRYNRAIPICDEIDWLILKVENNKELKKKFKIANQFNLGVLKGYLKSYNESLKIFSELIQSDSENDLYHDWYSQMKRNVLHKRLNYFSYVGLAIVLGDIFSDIIFEYSFNRYVVLLGFIIMVGAWLIPYGIQKIERMKKNK